MSKRTKQKNMKIASQKTTELRSYSNEEFEKFENFHNQTLTLSHNEQSTSNHLDQTPKVSEISSEKNQETKIKYYISSEGELTTTLANENSLNQFELDGTVYIFETAYLAKKLFETFRTMLAQSIPKDEFDAINKELNRVTFVGEEHHLSLAASKVESTSIVPGKAGSTNKADEKHASTSFNEVEKLTTVQALQTLCSKCGDYSSDIVCEKCSEFYQKNCISLIKL